MISFCGASYTFEDISCPQMVHPGCWVISFQSHSSLILIITEIIKATLQLLGSYSVQTDTNVSVTNVDLDFLFDVNFAVAVWNLEGTCPECEC